MKNDWDVFTSEGDGLRLIGTFITSEGEGLNNQYESMKLREAKVTTGGRGFSRALRYRGEGRCVRG